MTDTFLLPCYCIGWALAYFGILVIATFRAKRNQETFVWDPDDVSDPFFKGALFCATAVWPLTVFMATTAWLSDWLQKKILD